MQSYSLNIIIETQKFYTQLHNAYQQNRCTLIKTFHQYVIF